MRRRNEENGPGDVDVCIVVPPFDQIKLPLLGPAILAAACRQRGLRVHTVFGSIMLAARAGYEPYKAISRFYLDCILGERLFRPFAWPRRSRLRCRRCRTWLKRPRRRMRRWRP